MRPVSVYAIDFGTSNSLLAGVSPDGVLEPAPLDPTAQEPSILRSILFVSEDGEWSFGHEAFKSYVAHGTRGRFIRSMKRFLPMASVKDIPTIPGELFAKFQTGFYADPSDAVFKALGVQ